MIAVKKYTLLLTSIALVSFVSTVTATDYEPNAVFENSVYGYEGVDFYGEPTNCTFQFAAFDGSFTCISGKPSGWNRPKSDYTQTTTVIVVGYPTQI